MSDTDTDQFNATEPLEPNQLRSLSQWLPPTTDNHPIVDLEEQDIPQYRQSILPVPTENYSLVPDMMFGWKPRIFENFTPIPLAFDKVRLPVDRDPNTNQPYPTIFHGYRPKDSLKLQRKYQMPDTHGFKMNSNILAAYNFMSKEKARVDDRPFRGMRADPNELIFDSKFESGNLDRVVKTGPNEYDLYTRVDTNSWGHNQWYYFSITNINKPRRVRFNIVNFKKEHSLYEQGMTPNVYSKVKFSQGLGWHRAGENISYRPSKINRIGQVRRHYFQLTFDYTFEYSKDTVWFAYSIPYTYTQLTAFVSEVEASPYLTVSSLCKSLTGMNVPLLIITNLEQGTPITKKQVIVSGRVHPGETHGSFLMEGFIRYLLSMNKEAIELRNTWVFKIVPMLNPDGVVMGNSRTSFWGQDLNRQFRTPNHRLHPTVVNLKEMIAELAKNNKRVLAYFDMHAHSRKKGIFMYGPHYPLHNDKYYKMRVIPKILSEHAEAFRYYSCKFRNEKSKRKAARLVIWKEFNIMNSFTIEASFYGWVKDDRTSHSFNTSHLNTVGEQLGITLHEYISLITEEEREKEDRREQRKRARLAAKQAKKNSNGSQQASGRLNLTAPKPKISVSKTKIKRTMKEIIESIKDDTQFQEAEEEEDYSGSSDSNPSDDNLEEEELNKMQTEMVQVLDQYSSKSKKSGLGKIRLNKTKLITKKVKPPKPKKVEKQVIKIQKKAPAPTPTRLYLGERSMRIKSFSPKRASRQRIASKQILEDRKKSIQGIPITPRGAVQIKDLALNMSDIPEIQARISPPSQL